MSSYENKFQLRFAMTPPAQKKGGGEFKEMETITHRQRKRRSC